MNSRRRAERQPDDGGAPAEVRLLDEREHRGAEAEGAHRRAEPVDRCARMPGVAEAAAREKQEGHGDRHDVDEEREPPRRRSTNTPPTSGPTIIAEVVIAVQMPIARPCAGPQNVRGDQRQRTGHEEGARGALHRAGHDQDLGIRRRRDRDRGDAEADEADAQHEHAAVGVAHRPGDEDERAEGDEVGIHDPLLGRDPAAELAADRGQGDVDDRAVEERHERAEHRDRQHQPAGWRSSAHRCRRAGGLMIGHQPMLTAADDTGGRRGWPSALSPN